MENYNQKVLAFVLNLKDSKNIANLKTELVTFLKKFESDDKVYIYNNTGISFEKSSNAVAELARYDFEANLPLYDLIRDAIAALEFEVSLTKILVVVNDTPYDNYQVSKLVRIAKNAECEVHFFEIGTPEEVESYRKTLENSDYNLNKAVEKEGFCILPDLTNLASKLENLYKFSNDSGVVRIAERDLA
jgi:hypothetical protein